MDMKIGDKVKVDLSGLHPILGKGCVMDGTIKAISGNQVTVQVVPVNGQSEFTVDAGRIKRRVV